MSELLDGLEHARDALVDAIDAGLERGRQLCIVAQDLDAQLEGSADGRAWIDRLEVGRQVGAIAAAWMQAAAQLRAIEPAEPDEPDDELQAAA